ncbi:MAG: protein-S-isoprenylcysteine O-methyltransferase [Caldilineaceae bacterium]
MIAGKVIFIVALIMQIIIRYPYRKRVDYSKSDRQERFLLLLITIGGVVIPFIYIFSGWLAFADYRLPGWLVGVGAVIMAGGLWLFWRAHTDLGHNWSSTLEIQAQHTLVTTGVYRRIRHPMYSAMWLMILAQPFLLTNWLAGFCGLVTFGAMYFLRVPKEEALMLQTFGDPYRQYMAQTGRIFPTGGFR